MKAGGAINTCDEFGFTPLMRAAERGHLDVIKLLASAGADLLAKTNYGKTALEVALAKRQTAVVDYLQSLPQFSVVPNAPPVSRSEWPLIESIQSHEEQLAQLIQDSLISLQQEITAHSLQLQQVARHQIASLVAANAAAAPSSPTTAATGSGSGSGSSIASDLTSGSGSGSGMDSLVALPRVLADAPALTRYAQTLSDQALGDLLQQLIQFTGIISAQMTERRSQRDRKRDSPDAIGLASPPPKYPRSQADS
jgi:hypothetical protein